MRGDGARKGKESGLVCREWTFKVILGGENNRDGWVAKGGTIPRRRSAWAIVGHATCTCLSLPSSTTVVILLLSQ